MKKALSILMLLFINAIFSYKYLSREFDNAWIVAAILVVIQLFGFLYLSKINIPKKLFNSAVIITGLGIIALVVIAYLKIPLDTLNVDRWSVIDSFWSFYLMVSILIWQVLIWEIRQDLCQCTLYYPCLFGGWAS